MKPFKPGARCNIEQYKLLKKCSEARDVAEWNNYRQRYRLKRYRDVETWLDGADFTMAHLDGAELSRADLRGANARLATVNGHTLLDTRYVDEQTDFSGVGLSAARMEPGLRQLLEYSIRRHGWEEWYVKHRFAGLPVRLFWAFSDYGRSTRRIAGALWCCAAFFAALYLFVGVGCYLLSGGANTGPVANLLVDRQTGETVSPLILPWRALYFSAVTMTTLGFGDIYAEPNSWFGHVILMVEVLVGYILLGALVTRFAVLFQAGGPAQRFFRDKTMTERFWQRLRVYARFIRRGWRR